MKRCSKCGETKPLTEFHKNKRKKDGLRCHCKVCAAEYKRRYRQENKEAIAEYQRQYREDYRETSLEYQRQWREENKERLRQYQEKRKAKQPACVYQIVNSVNGRVYVGETTRGEIRWIEHRKKLRGNYHDNSNLQADFNQFGEDVFEWSIIQELPKDKEVLEREETNTIQRLLAEGKELYNIILN